MQKNCQVYLSRSHGRHVDSRRHDFGCAGVWFVWLPSSTIQGTHANDHIFWLEQLCPGRSSRHWKNDPGTDVLYRGHEQVRSVIHLKSYQVQVGIVRMLSRNDCLGRHCQPCNRHHIVSQRRQADQNDDGHWKTIEHSSRWPYNQFRVYWRIKNWTRA